MVGPQDDPATEAVAQVNDSHAAAEAHDTGQGHPQRGDEDLKWERKCGWGFQDGCAPKRSSGWVSPLPTPHPAPPYVVLVEEGQIPDHAHPDQQRGRAQEDAADVIARQVLGAESSSTRWGRGDTALQGCACWGGPPRFEPQHCKIP